MKYKFIPVDNDLNKAIAFANSLDQNNVINVQKIKQKEFYIPTLDVITKLQDSGWHLKGVAEQRGKNRKISNNFIQLQHPDFAIQNSQGKNEAFTSITLSNSCNGSSPLQMDLGTYRLVCSNGAIAFDGFEQNKIKHTEINYRDLDRLVASMNVRASKLLTDVNLEQFGFDPKSMQLAEARQYVALELARACGIPAYFLSAEATSMTYSNAVSERRSLVDFSLRPILKAIKERLSLPDFVPYGVECFL